MDFPIIGLMDQDGCRQKLFGLLHLEGFACPRCGASEGLNLYRRQPDSPDLDYRCKECRRVFNMFTATLWQGTHLSPAQTFLILRGIAQEVLTAKLAREVGISRRHLLKLSDDIRARALDAADHAPLPDDHTEVDEMYQDAGEQRFPHTDPVDPPRRRGNRPKGHGTWETDRPPVPGVAGRESGRVWFRVGRRSTAAELVNVTVGPATKPGEMVYIDDWSGHNPLGSSGRGHATVNDNRGEFARDDDGDGAREVHCNTREGIWTGLRNFLRPFRGVNEVYLEQYVIIFEAAYNLKTGTDAFLRVLLGSSATTELVT